MFTHFYFHIQTHSFVAFVILPIIANNMKEEETTGNNRRTIGNNVKQQKTIKTT
jgi:hypothetical protein